MTNRINNFPWEGDHFIRPTDAAQYLNTNNRTLKEWRSRDYGPAYMMFDGGAKMYSLASVKRFAEKNKKPRSDDPLGLI